MRAAIIFAGVVTVLWAAEPFFRPLALGLAIWGIFALGARWLDRRTRGWSPLSRRVAGLGAATGVLAALTGLQSVLAGQTAALSRELGTYERNLDALLGDLADRVGLDPAPNVLDAFAGLAGLTVVVVCYVVFLFLEARVFEAKLSALIPEPARRARTSKVIDAAIGGVATFLGVQTLVALLQAALTWLVLWAIGLDAPLFWAVLVFALGYVPTLGSLFGTAAPTIFSLAQFGLGWETWTIFVVLAAVQLGASNVLQPSLMGGALNLSPLAVTAAVFGGGALWGVVGALLAAPALSVFAIVCVHTPALRGAAILLSRDGRPPSPTPADRPG